jgi:hypothetical protein
MYPVGCSDATSSPISSGSFSVTRAADGGGGEGSFGLWPGPLGTFLSGESSPAPALAVAGGGGALAKKGGVRFRRTAPTGEWRAANAVHISIISGRSTSSAAATFLLAAIATGCCDLLVHYHCPLLLVLRVPWLPCFDICRAWIASAGCSVELCCQWQIWSSLKPLAVADRANYYRYHVVLLASDRDEL